MSTYMTKDGQSIMVNDGTVPYWIGLGWSVDDNVDLVGDFMLEARGLNMLKRQGAVAETFTRAGNALSSVANSSGSMRGSALPLLKGQRISRATFFCTSAVSGATSQWFALYDKAFNLIRVTNDDGSAAWATSSEKTLTFTTPFDVPADDTYYLGAVVVATTAPGSLASASSIGSVMNLTPRLAFAATGMSTPGAATPTITPASHATPPYAWVD